MKWVGRVLLCVLIASTLFALKPSDFQTKSAYAQTSQDCNSVVLALDIELLRNIGGSQINLTNAVDCARITSPGQDPTIYYRLIVQFGNNVSQTSFINWLAGVAGRVGYPSIDAAGCAVGSNTADPFQPLPQSWSCTSSYTGLPSFPESSNLKAWVNIGEVLTATLAANPNHVSAGGSTTLSWNSPRAQQLSIDQGIGNVARPSGSRSVDNIQQETTYTLTAVGYTDVVQAQATVTIDLPDLVLDTTGLTVALVNDKNQTITTQPPLVKYGNELKSIFLNGLILKNNGPGIARGDIYLTVTLLMKDGRASKLIYATESPTDPFSINIASGAQITLPAISLDGYSGTDLDDINTALGFGVARFSRTTADLKITIDSRNGISETSSGETNNETTIGDFITWPALLVTVHDANGKPYRQGRVETTITGKDTLPIINLSNGLGKAVIGVLPSLNSGIYSILAELRLKDTVIDSKTIFIASNTILQTDLSMKALVQLHFSLESGFSDQPLGDDPIFQSLLAPRPESGIVHLLDSEGIEYTENIVDGIAIFDENSSGTGPLPAGTYKLKSVEASMGYDQDVVEYVWPEPTRKGEKDQDPANPPFVIYDSRGVGTLDLYLLLAKACREDLPSRSNFCWYDDLKHIQSSQAQAEVNDLSQAIVRYKGWPQSPLHSITNVKFIPYLGLPLIGQYVPWKDKSLFQVENRIFLNRPDVIERVGYHELIHALDLEYQDPNNSQNLVLDLNFLSSLPAYKSSIDQQFVSETGQKLWDLVSWGCAYSSDPGCEIGYSWLSLSYHQNSYWIETLAEEKSTVCLNRQLVMDRLNNIQTAWTEKYSTSPPADLIEMRDLTVNRLNGKDARGTLISQHFADWQNGCLNHP